MNKYEIKKYIEENFDKDESIHYASMGSGVYYEEYSSLNIHEWLKKYNCERLDDLEKKSSKTVSFRDGSSYNLYIIDNVILYDYSYFCSDEHYNSVYLYELENKLDNVLTLEKMIEEMRNEENSRLLTIWNNLNELENEEIKYRLLKHDYWNEKIYKNTIYIRDLKSNKDKGNKEYIISENDKKVLELFVENYWLRELDDIYRDINDITSGELTRQDLNQKIRCFL